MAQTASVYLTVLVTIERFIVVCHPLKARSLCTTKRTRLGVLLVMSFSVLYNMSRFFEYTYHTEEITEEVNLLPVKMISIGFETKLKTR